MKAPEPYLVWRDREHGATDAVPDQSRLLNRDRINVWLRNGALAALILIAVPPFPMLLSPVWLLAMITGYAATVLIAIVMLLPLRTVLQWPNVRISVPRHRRLAEWALGLSVLHTALFLISDQVSLEYLMPSQPRYMLAGNVGLILLLVLTVTSLERPRVALFKQNKLFRSVHVVISIMSVVLVAAHMIGSNVYISHPFKAALCAVTAAGLIVVTLRRPQPPETSNDETSKGSVT